MTPGANSSVGVVLPAAGSGRRMGGAPKQTRLLGDAPVWIQSARAFARLPDVGAVVVVAPEPSLAEMRRQLDRYALTAEVVAGGATRQASVRNGLDALPPLVETVLVHDAVRPFVDRSLIHRVIAGVQDAGAAAPAVPVADTLRQGDGARFGPTVPREGLWAMQTPQGARRDLLTHAYARAGDAVATDEVGLLQRAGVDVMLVEGDARNIKLTRPEDWETALAVWPGWRAARE